MPEIARFYGIVIKMYFQQAEHNPPHIHVFYGDYMGSIEIETLEMSEGSLPPKILSLVRKWVEIHKDGLLNIWNTQKFIKLPPLE